MRSPKSDSNRSRSSRLSFNIFYFATGDAQKDSGLEIKFMLDTGASCSIINYRSFWEISQFHHPIRVHSKKTNQNVFRPSGTDDRLRHYRV